MQIHKYLRILSTHTAMLGLGFALGIYLLPILIQPEAPDEATVERAKIAATYTATFSKDREDSDSFHWGEGVISLSDKQLAFNGEIAPGPDYKLYLSPVFVETENSFKAHKGSMRRIADVKNFDRFVVELPLGVDLEQYNTVVIWCETFSEFISSAQYR